MDHADVDHGLTATAHTQMIGESTQESQEGSRGERSYLPVPAVVAQGVGESGLLRALSDVVGAGGGEA